MIDHRLTFTFDEMVAVVAAIDLAQHAIGGTTWKRDRAALLLQLEDLIPAKELFEAEIYRATHTVE
jgi:hypothetical protein